MSLVASARTRARRTGREFALDWRDIYFDIRAGRCRVSGIPFAYEWLGEGSNPFAPSIDRIDSSRGYTRDNVRVVVWAVNRALGEWRDEVLRRVALGLLKTSGEIP